MADTTSIEALLADLPPEVEWSPGHPGDPASLEEAERSLKAPIPEDYKRFLLSSDGAMLSGSGCGITFLEIKELPEFANDYRWAPELRYMLVLGFESGGDYIYYMDPLDLLGRGAGAIFAASMSSAHPAYSSFAADSLLSLFKRVIDGDDATAGPMLGDTEQGVPEAAIRHLKDIDYSNWLEWASALTPPDDVVAMTQNPPEGVAFAEEKGAPAERIEQAERELGVVLPPSYTTFLRFSDGGSLRNQLSAITFYPSFFLKDRRLPLAVVADRAPELAAIVFFGTDPLYFRFGLDADNVLGRGVNAIYGFHRQLAPEHQLARAIFIGSTFGEMIAKLMTGNDLLGGFYDDAFMEAPDDVRWPGGPFAT